MLNVYFYPKINYESTQSPNPYIFHFEKALERHYHLVNKQYNKNGILDFFKYFFKTDVYILNWIEDLPLYRFGKIQTLFFTVFLFFARIAGKKIVWVLHNKYSHFTQDSFWTKLMFGLLMRHSELILTHSSSGVDFVQEDYPRFVHKIKYFIHPILPAFSPIASSKKQYDLFIWGTLHPYKGVLEFLKYLKESFKPFSLKIFICGRCFDEVYKKELMRYIPDGVEYEDKFYELEDIRNFAQQSKYVLFTHKPTSVLSSGALMDAIRMGAKIIGPNFGAFRDLKSSGLVRTYDNYDDIRTILNEDQVDQALDLSGLDQFFCENSWEAFGDKLKLALDEH
ncbi:MAG: glycosyltransferase [Haliscomenobacter sp.]|nr:glycosyltransferase [Haliscomenobacter sp.]MBK9492568.1 glycosyltransferase [Haliscomenobacter sp.]